MDKDQIIEKLKEEVNTLKQLENDYFELCNCLEEDYHEYETYDYNPYSGTNIPQPNFERYLNKYYHPKIKVYIQKFFDENFVKTDDAKDMISWEIIKNKWNTWINNTVLPNYIKNMKHANIYNREIFNHIYYNGPAFSYIKLI